MKREQLILNFLKKQKHMIIATVNKESNPQAALVGFAEMDDLSLIFGTYTTSRKFHNLQDNSHIAVVFGDDCGITVQYEGIALVFRRNELDKYKQIYFKKTPSFKKYESFENQIYIKIVPSWIRYTNYNMEPEEIFELTEF